jgi:hypothetical protein
MLGHYNLFGTLKNHTVDTPCHTVSATSSHVFKETKKILILMVFLCYETHKKAALKEPQGLLKGVYKPLRKAL